jgi:hypothetical protein
MMAPKLSEQVVVWMAVLSVGLVMMGCATMGPIDDDSMVIKYNPWKQRKGTAGAPPPDRSIEPGDQRFKAIQGTYGILTQNDQVGDGDDWVVFDGDGNFESGPKFYPHAIAWPDGPPKGYLTGFYVVDVHDGVLHLVFCINSFTEAHYQSVGSDSSLPTIAFNGKVYHLKKLQISGPHRQASRRSDDTYFRH